MLVGRTTLLIVALSFVADGIQSGCAQEPLPAKYDDAVVAKAGKVLADQNLRRSGKTIQSTATAEISRAITGLNRQRRELRFAQQQWQTIADKISAIDQQLNLLNVQYGELNLRLSRVAGVDTAANNRIVGLINAIVAKRKLLVDTKAKLQADLTQQRATVNQAEADYAETVLSIRRDLDAIYEQIKESIDQQSTKIAFRVMHANFDTPAEPTAASILGPVEKRIKRIEEAIFSEAIPLDDQRGSLLVNVVVGKNTVPMVVDSGATLVSLPRRIADSLEISVPQDAPKLRMILADGRSIPARGVLIPKLRVGNFEAENVRAAVLDESAVEAEPLLGMSFLGRFKFEIDQAEKSLKLLRVQTD